MAVKLIRPSALKRAVPVVFPASTAFALNSLVSADRESSTTANIVATTSSKDGIFGVVTRKIVSGDSDYASTKTRTVIVDEAGLYEVDCGTTSVTANYVGALCDFSDASTLDVGTTTKGHFLIEKVLSTTKVQGRIRKWDGLTTSA